MEEQEGELLPQYPYLFPGVVGALAGVGVVAGPVERHEGLAVAPLVIHLVALLDLEAMV